MDVVYYQWKNESDGDNLHVGIIAEDSPREILNAEGKAVNVSTYNSFLLAAIKAQQTMIEQLQKEVQTLRRKVGQ